MKGTRHHISNNVTHHMKFDGAAFVEFYPISIRISLIWRQMKLSYSFFAVNDGRSSIPQYAGIRNALVTIYQQEGIRGLYRGVVPNVWGSGTAWGLYFLL